MSRVYTDEEVFDVLEFLLATTVISGMTTDRLLSIANRIRTDLHDKDGLNPISIAHLMTTFLYLTAGGKKSILQIVMERMEGVDA